VLREKMAVNIGYLLNKKTKNDDKNRQKKMKKKMIFKRL
jgi:hypothetical protein